MLQILNVVTDHKCCFKFEMMLQIPNVVTNPKCCSNPNVVINPNCLFCFRIPFRIRIWIRFRIRLFWIRFFRIRLFRIRFFRIRFFYLIFSNPNFRIRFFESDFSNSIFSNPISSNPSVASPSDNLISLSYSMPVFSANLFGLFYEKIFVISEFLFVCCVVSTDSMFFLSNTCQKILRLGWPKLSYRI